MPAKKLSVREARMELNFAILQGDKHKIAEAEKQLQEAISRSAQKNKPEGKGIRSEGKHR